MTEIKFVIGDPKTGKSYQKTLETADLEGKKVSEKLNGDFLGLEGYEVQITGGSDNAGFPMRKEIEGVGRKRGYFSGGVGVKINRAGMKKRKTVCCNTITKDIVQVNLKVIKAGSKTLEEIFAKPVAEEPKAE